MSTVTIEQALPQNINTAAGFSSDVATISTDVPSLNPQMDLGAELQRELMARSQGAQPVEIDPFVQAESVIPDPATIVAHGRTAGIPIAIEH